MVAAAEYYRDKLGFEIRGYFFEDPAVFGMVARDGLIVQLRLMEADRGGPNSRWHAETLDAYVWVDDADSLYAEFQQRGADIVAPPPTRVYGMKELLVRDLDGYVICFGQDIPTI